MNWSGGLLFISSYCKLTDAGARQMWYVVGIAVFVVVASPMRAMLRFQRAVQGCPRQVVRYAYGGEPLWSVADPPSCRPPACMCGAPRCFELQLMPGLLFMLRVDTFAPREVEPGGGGDGEDLKALGLGGMDWGVLTVWSCSDSCDASCEEIAIVQPSEDAGWSAPGPDSQGRAGDPP